MGTWSAGIFGSDLALDVRDTYRLKLESGASDSDATEQTEADIATDEPEFWIALAATQYRHGRLDPRVRDRALEAIEPDLDAWRIEDPRRFNERRRNLERLRNQLLGPARLRTNVRPYRPMTTDLLPGELIAYRLDSGAFMLLRIVAIEEGRSGDRVPVAELIGHVRDVPGVEEMASRPAWRHFPGINEPGVLPFHAHLTRMTRDDRRRLAKVGLTPTGSEPPARAHHVYVSWAALNRTLSETGVEENEPRRPSN